MYPDPGTTIEYNNASVLDFLLGFCFWGVFFLVLFSVIWFPHSIQYSASFEFSLPHF